MFGTLGGPEVILILVVALIVFGPRRLPEIGKSMGKMLAEFRKASNDFKRTIDDELEAEKASEAQSQLPAPTPADAPASSTPAVAEPEAEWRPPYAAPPSTTDATEPPPAAAGAGEPEVSGASTAPSSEPRVEAPVEAVVSRNRSADE
jgi:TatA/E family protein of Tat protein translocase